jgi:hypothetical protein
MYFQAIYICYQLENIYFIQIVLFYIMLETLFPQLTNLKGLIKHPHVCTINSSLILLRISAQHAAQQTYRKKIELHSSA